MLLGLLGHDVLAYEQGGGGCSDVRPLLRRTWERYTADLSCPQLYGDGRIATQPFEGGTMVWVGRADGGRGQIVVMVGNAETSATWQLYSDSYVEGEPVGTDELPPPGKYAHVRGFGKLWRTVPEVRASLGWGIAPEQGDVGTTLQISGRQGSAATVVEGVLRGSLDGTPVEVGAFLARWNL